MKYTNTISIFSLFSLSLFRFAHGMGRSGNLKDSQPKAIGSTLLSFLTHKLTISALRTWGFSKSLLRGGLNIMPVCTGMSLMLALMAVQSKYKKVIWLRIDQKSCLKSVLAAGFEMVVVEGKLDCNNSEEIVTDLEAIERAISDANGEIHAVVSCVSCFAPRAPDSVVQISHLCSKSSIAHIVNAAYGGTSPRACNLLNNSASNGRIDAVVMSLDKNFMVPVGGAIVFGPNPAVIEGIAKRYAGRASISHIVDLFITLIGLGRSGLERMKLDRIECFDYFKKRLEEETAQINGMKLMNTPHNDISMALRLPEGIGSSLGSQLFHRNISGARVIEVTGKSLSLEGIAIINFGSHSSKWTEKFCYLTVAAAVGSEREDIDIFIKKLVKLLNK